jgi:hypothetical protein
MNKDKSKKPNPNISKLKVWSIMLILY